MPRLGVALSLGPGARGAAAAGRSDVPVDEMLAVRIHETLGARAAPFMEPVLISRTGLPDASGRMIPRLRIFRVVDAPGPVDGRTAR